MANEPDQFPPHEDFAELADDTRAPALPIGAPAITRLVAFWKPKGLTRSQWAVQIENFILEVYHRQVAAGGSVQTPSLTINDKKEPDRLYLLENYYSANTNDRTPQPISQTPRRHQSVRMGLKWEGAPVLLNFELHDEFFMLSSSIDLSKTGPQQLGLNARKLAHDMGAFSAGVEERYQALIKGQPENTASGISKDVNNTMYHQTWGALEKALFGKPVRTVGEGRQFADFRSCVAALEKLEHKGRTVLPGHAATPEHYTAEPKPFDSLEAYTYAKTLLPFMTVETGRASDTEYTFSTILNCQGLLATALGITLPETPKGVRPQTELFVVTRDRQWQTGRMIDRGHHMGVLRLAALHDLKHLNVADGKLQELEKELQKIGEALSKPVNEEEHGGHIKALSAQLLKVSQQLAEAGKGIEGGLANRLARSQIYQQEFNQLVKEMRIDRIDGFQPYDQFVRRLLGANYDFINGLNQRHGRIQEQISSLGRQLRAAELGRQTGAIEKFQKVAEAGFFLAPFEYYLSYILTSFVENIPLYQEHPKIGKAATIVGTYIIGISVLFRERIERRYKKTANWIKSSKKGRYRWRHSKRFVKNLARGTWRQLSKSTTWPSP